MGGITSNSIPGSFPSASSSSAQTTPAATVQTPTIAVDASSPTTSIQVRLADGTRLVLKFNQSHTLDDLYQVVKS